MSNNQNNNLPMYRVSFARITGQDENGQDILSRPKEIGAVWARKGGKSGGILSLDIIPVELAQRQGVIFLVPAVQAQIFENQAALDARSNVGSSQ